MYQEEKRKQWRTLYGYLCDTQSGTFTGSMAMLD